MNRRPSDEEARSVRNKQGKDSSSRTRRLENVYIFQLEVVTVVNDAIFYLKTHECKARNILALQLPIAKQPVIGRYPNSRPSEIC